MSELKKQQENQRSAPVADETEIAMRDWTLRLRDEAEGKATLSFEGEDVIIVENLRDAVVSLKPISGDFSITHYFTACAKSWLETFKRSEAEIADAPEIWLQFKAFKEKLGLSVTEFLDQFTPESETFAPGRF